MDSFEWNEKYSVGNDQIDGHHKKLFSLFNEIGDIISSDNDSPLFSTIKVISELNVYAIFHFKEEEKRMEEANYPDIEEHKRLHKEFVTKVSEFKEAYMNNSSLVNYDIYKFLCDWLATHILEVDAKYKEYI